MRNILLVVLVLAPGCFLRRESLGSPDSNSDAFAATDTGSGLDSGSIDARPDAVSLDTAGPDTLAPPDTFSPLDSREPPDTSTPSDACGSTLEACNARDDNCNGSVDEGACLIEGDACTEWTFGDHVYLLCTGETDWEGARSSCTTFGSGYDLAVLTDSGEEGAAAIRVDTENNDAWVGLSDRTMEGAFRWNDGTTAAPGSFDADGGEDVDCFVIDAGRTLFRDRNCGDDNDFICEAPIMR